MHDKLTKLCGVAATLVILINFVLKDVPNYFYFDAEIKSLLSNLSVSYIIAYIFYLLQVYVPELKRKEILKNRISSPLSITLSTIEEVLTPFLNNRDFLNNNVSVKSIEELATINLMAPSSISLHIVNGQMVYQSYYENLVSNKKRIIEQLDEISMFYSTDFELSVLCNEIKYSELHSRLDVVHTIRNVRIAMGQGGDLVDSTILEDALIEYVELAIRLRRYMSQEQIQSTVSTLSI